LKTLRVYQINCVSPKNGCREAETDFCIPNVKYKGGSHLNPDAGPPFFVPNKSPALKMPSMMFSIPII